MMSMLDFIAALFAAALAAMGVGGGGLLIIYLLLVLGMGQTEAQGINLLFFLAASLCSLPFHIKAKRISLETVLIFAPAGAIGAYFGCKLGLSLDPKYLKTAFGILLIASGGITLSRELLPMLRSIRKKAVKAFDKGEKTNAK